MSKGSQVVPVRFGGKLLERMRLQIAQRNVFTANAPWTLSDFVRVAAQEKLAKMERSRRSAQKRAARRPADPPS